MTQITEYIAQINTRSYNEQCKCIKNMHVILYNLPCYLAGIDIEINEKKQLWFNFWDELHDDAYFYDDKGIIQIKCVKLTNNMYQIKVPVINTATPITSTSYIITS